MRYNHLDYTKLKNNAMEGHAYILKNFNRELKDRVEDKNSINSDLFEDFLNETLNGLDKFNKYYLNLSKKVDKFFLQKERFPIELNYLEMRN